NGECVAHAPNKSGGRGVWKWKFLLAFARSALKGASGRWRVEFLQVGVSVHDSGFDPTFVLFILNYTGRNGYRLPVLRFNCLLHLRARYLAPSHLALALWELNVADSNIRGEHVHVRILGSGKQRKRKQSQQQTKA